MAASLKKVQELDKLLKVSQYGRKINFGRRDASIEFGTANSSLIISGSNSGIVMSGSGIYIDSSTIVLGSASSSDSFLALDSNNKIIKSAAGGARSVAGDTDNGIATWVTSDNTFAVESNLTYDGTTFVINDDTMIKDDHKLYFGTNSDAYIEYDENGANSLVISGSAVGLSLSGSALYADPITVSSGSIANASSYLALDSSNKIVLASASGSLSGSLEHYYTHHNYNYTGTALHYIPINSPVENTDLTYVFVQMIAPWDGKLVKVIINANGDHAGSGTAPGSTVIGLHLDLNTTAATTVTETLAQSSAGVGVTKVFNFTSNNTFARYQRLSISIDATAQLYDVRVTCVWKYDTGS